MLFLFGEKLKIKEESVGQFTCLCCSSSTEFFHREEKYYFTFFFISLLPLNVAADYWQCSSCGETYVPNTLDRPSYLESMHNVLAFLLSGYGFDNLEAAQQVFNKVCKSELDPSAVLAKKEFYSSIEELTEDLKKLCINMNFVSRVKIVQVTYLLIYASCDIEFNDRLRVNLIANAMEISLETVNKIIEELKSQNYLDIKAKVEPAFR